MAQVSIETLLAGRKVIVISPEVKVARACQILAEYGLSALPVVEEGRLVGLLSRTRRCLWLHDRRA